MNHLQVATGKEPEGQATAAKPVLPGSPGVPVAVASMANPTGKDTGKLSQAVLKSRYLRVPETVSSHLPKYREGTENHTTVVFFETETAGVGSHLIYSKQTLG